MIKVIVCFDGVKSHHVYLKTTVEAVAFVWELHETGATIGGVSPLETSDDPQDPDVA
jgi:hypothetical protein